jgi:hypothetical protein
MLVRVAFRQTDRKRYTYYSPVPVHTGDWVVVILENGCKKTVEVTSVIHTKATTEYRGKTIKPIFGTVLVLDATLGEKP